MRNRIVIATLTICMLTSCMKDEVYPTEKYSCNFSFNDSSSTNPKDAVYNSLINDIKTSGAPGIQMAIRSDEDGMWMGCAGKADLKNNTNLQNCNITRVGSTVKTFTAVTILLLAEEGKINLDDKVTDYLTGEQIKDIENANKATIKQLLQHSSGIYNYIQSLTFQTASTNDLVKEWSPDELLSYARGKKAYFEPGSDVYYSNTNYILLGMIISKIEGKHFYEVFEEKIFIPQGLTSTKFAATDHVPDNIIRGYVDLYSNLNVINATYYSGWDYYTADGGLISNAYDLNQFMTALFNEEIITKSSLDMMMSWKQPNEPDTEFFPLYYGLGIFRMDTPWGQAYFHSGDAIGYYAFMAYFPESKTSIAWAVNGNYGKIDEFTSSKKAMEKVFGAAFN